MRDCVLHYQFLSGDCSSCIHRGSCLECIMCPIPKAHALYGQLVASHSTRYLFGLSSAETSMPAPNKSCLDLETAQAHHHSTTANLISPAGRQSVSTCRAGAVTLRSSSAPSLGSILSCYIDTTFVHPEQAVRALSRQLIMWQGHKLNALHWELAFFIRAGTQSAHSRTGPSGQVEFLVKKH